MNEYDIDPPVEAGPTEIRLDHPADDRLAIRIKFFNPGTERLEELPGGWPRRRSSLEPPAAARSK